MSAISSRIVKSLLLLIIGAAALVWLAWQDRAAPLALTTLTGETISLPSRQGLVLLNFWATGCPACLKEMPELERLYDDYRDQGLQVVAIAMPYDPPNRVMDFVHRRRLPYPVALDPLGRISEAFQVRLIPTWILLGPDNRMLWRHTGIPDFDHLEFLLQHHLYREN